MEKIKYTLLIALSLLAMESSAQESSVIRKGLLSAQVTISPSFMFSGKASYFYLHGGLEGYVSSKISFTGEGFYYLGSGAENSAFDYNHSLFFGAARHFTRNNNDLYIGLQPGLSFTKLSAEANHLAQSQLGVNPLFSPVAGYTFYLGKIFHFFVQTRLVLGQHNYDLHKDLTEFRFSAGLGFNLNTMKAK